ncbi:hypothetical protein [Phenylobacterium sp.]|uniref:hypothetical protein n=1 Tax=Phenylobacterium sp. TaxID=1871053 RepID=UPI002730943C|nr:hypothetical protein [Phenylobacterium sp.]MDP1875711.1 hypothetical protein [Phenylobacterium sp.]MDP3491465.1 hypothetical protein [Phenylobacterium sp.]
MNLKLVLSTSAAALLMASAVQAQTVQGGVTGDLSGQAAGALSGPADHTRSSTGLPSVDSTRPTGADAGRTMTGGQMSGSVQSEGEAVNAPGAMSGSMRGSAQAGATMHSDGMSGHAGGSATAHQGQMDGEARSAGSMGAMASSTAGGQVTTNGPIPDTEENRAKYGGPQSRAGKASDPGGN